MIGKLLSRNQHQDPQPSDRVLVQRKCACGNHTVAGDECDTCRRSREDETLQRAAISAAPMGDVPSVVHDVLRSPGQPLDSGARAFMEPRFGHDFSHVRVHTDARAAESARAVNALAYTVGRDVVFGAGRYAPGTAAGSYLLAHELVHVIQQEGNHADLQARTVIDSNHPSEHEAERVSAEVMAGESVSISNDVSTPAMQCAKGDMVAYTGGSDGILMVIQKKKLIFSTRAVSGNPGRQEYEVNAGPIPTGTYMLHPAITRPKVTSLQGGICGANGISSGYQEITSNDQAACADPTNHYCTISCPSPSDSGQRCFTPKDCWGEKRIKIEGTARVANPTGGFVTRSGFYIHGGNHAVAVTSGCIKVFDNTAFDEIRKLNGTVPLCVGGACPSFVGTAVTEAFVDAISGIFSDTLEDVF